MSYFGWVTKSNTVCWDISNDNGSSSNNSIVANTDAGFDYASIANVDVLSNIDFASNLGALAALQHLRVGGHFNCGDGYTGADLGIPTNRNSTGVEQLRVGTNDDIVSNRDVVAIVAVEGYNNVNAATKMTGNSAFTRTKGDPPGCYNVLEMAIALARANLHGSVVDAVEAVHRFRAVLTLIYELLVVGQKWLACKHLVFFALGWQWGMRVPWWRRD